MRNLPLVLILLVSLPIATLAQDDEAIAIASSDTVSAIDAALEAAVSRSERQAADESPIADAEDDSTEDADDAPAAPVSRRGRQDDGGADAAAEGGDKADDCEEAWEYMEFLKKDIKKKIEDVMQQTLFQPKPLLEQTVADAMSEVLVIRDSVLDRVKKIRTGDESITICEAQGIKQEEFLSTLRLEVMGVLLRLIESDAATEGALQEVGKLLLTIRTKVNGKITQLIMLRENGIVTDVGGDCPDCDFLKKIKTDLDTVIEGGEGEEGAEGGQEVTLLTMLLMTIDQRIGNLYNIILGEVDEGPRTKASDELRQLKGISGSIDVILSQMVEDPENANKIKRLVSRDCVKVRNEVNRFLEKCAEGCTSFSPCDACGAKRIDEVVEKLGDYNISLITQDEEDARESIRSDLITYLTSLNGEMTTLLTTKIESENGTLEQCDKEILEVINSIKAPLWMLVNTTLFGNTDLVFEMVSSLKFALLEMRSKYCSDETPTAPPPESCELEEIDQSYIWIDDIDKIIADSLFKLAEKDPVEARKETLLGFVTLRSTMEVRVKELYQQNLICPEESSQIKNVYSLELSKCIAEMMNPRYLFAGKTRAERVQCIKQLRVTIEQRRGTLLLNEIERRIRDNRGSNNV